MEFVFCLPITKEKKMKLVLCLGEEKQGNGWEGKESCKYLLLLLLVGLVAVKRDVYFFFYLLQNILIHIRGCGRKIKIQS